MNETSFLKHYNPSDYERIIVLSPHLDDAIFSCGGFINLARKKASVLVVSVDASSMSITPRKDGSDPKLVEVSRKNYTNPSIRRQEDRLAMEKAGCNYIHLGFSDCVYRRSSTSGELLYRKGRSKWISPSVEDANYIEELYFVINRLCFGIGRVLVLCPLGVGYHVDHAIVAAIGTKLLRKRLEVLFYEDFPYSYSLETAIIGERDMPQNAIFRLFCEAKGKYYVTIDPEVKRELIECYTSQTPIIFGSKEKLLTIIKKYANDKGPREIFWKIKPIGE